MALGAACRHRHSRQTQPAGHSTGCAPGVCCRCQWWAGRGIRGPHTAATRTCRVGGWEQQGDGERMTYRRPNKTMHTLRTTLHIGCAAGSCTPPRQPPPHLSVMKARSRAMSFSGGRRKSAGRLA